MRLIWWMKHGEYDYELCVERTALWKKEVMNIRGWGHQWHRLPSCKVIEKARTLDQIYTVLTAIEWGYHNDKERKDITERVNRNGWI